MGALAEFERSLIKERQKRIEIIKKKVVHKGRTKALIVE
jgi:DNA invertase Pin-like site-specific DNA recombinase